MDFPPEISFRDVEDHDELEPLIRAQIAKLERHFDHLIGVRVTIEKILQKRNDTAAYRCRVEMSVPTQGELVAIEQPKTEQYQTHPAQVIRLAFEKATRVLEDYKGRLRTTHLSNEEKVEAARGWAPNPFDM